jgi:hypothetical protein
MIQPSLASERIKVHEIHSFFAQANSFLNSPSLTAGRNFLIRNIAEGAMFENNIKLYQPGHPAAYDVWWNKVYSPYYYRYPYAYDAYFTTTSYKEMGKWEMISNFEDKKRLIVGYQPEYVISGIKMRPDASMAVVDLELKEYSKRYEPYSPHLTEKVLHAKSKCKAYLGKHNDSVVMSRMDCNTSTNMPF